MKQNGSKAWTVMILSADAELRGNFNDVASKHGFSIQLEMAVHAGGATGRHLERIRRFRPDLLLLDFDDDPEGGCRLAARIVEATPSTCIVGASWSESREVLVAAMRAGVSELVQKPASRPQLEESLTRIQRRLGGREATEVEEGRTFAFFGAKGGAGTTTVASNFAIHLHAQTGKRTLLVDLDLELGEVAIFLGVEPSYSVVDLLKSLHRLDEDLLETYLQSHDSGIEVLAAPYRPREARGVSTEQIREMLEYLAQQFPFVVVDVSNTLSDAAIGAFEASDELMVVSQVDVPSVRNIQRCRSIFETVSGQAKELHLVLNRYGGRGEISVEDIEEAIGSEVFWTLSSDYDSVVYSINTGRPLVMNVPSPCSQEIEGLVSRVLGTDGPAATDSAGLISRAVGRLMPRRGSSASRPAGEVTSRLAAGREAR
ncbi:MAG: AAA family ATPase [Halobacteriales archaeon]|nr:AAA family ATPase [Halobacteriales archaeon]